jgi:hypothetical protein
MLLLTRETDDRGLAVALNGMVAHRRHRDGGHLAPERLAGGDQRRQVGLIASGERIGDDGSSRHLAQRRLARESGFVAGFIDQCDNFSDAHFALGNVIL